MELYSYLTLESFLDASNVSNSRSLRLQLPNLMYAFSEDKIYYGLSLLRRSIQRYEEIHYISKEDSKREIPFFRNRRKMLIGPEMEMYACSLYETPSLPHDLEQDTLLMKITLDYEALAEYCLTENCNLVRCKYDAEKCIDNFISQLDVEYDKFFYTEEHTGFKTDSRFFSMLCNASLEIVDSRYEKEKEWRLMQFCPPEDASYHITGNELLPYIQISIPYDCIKNIELLDWENHKSTYAALAGLMQRIGLPPERYLEGLVEEE